jgi:hypothetical protein
MRAQSPLAKPGVDSDHSLKPASELLYPELNPQ